MKNNLGIIFAVIAILFGLYAIIIFTPTIDLAIGLISLTFGVLAIIWILRAQVSLSPGSSLREFTIYFTWCLLLLILFSVWQTLANFLSWTGLLYNLQYIFISIAYVVFVGAAYKILQLGREFGFEVKAKEIKKMIKSKRRKDR